MFVESGFQFISVQQFLCDRVQHSCRLLAESLGMAQETVLPREISFNRGREKTAIVYGCAIAFQLAHLWQKPAMALATQIAAVLTTLLSNECQVTVVPPGTIRLQLQDRYLAGWLDQLTGDRISLPDLALFHRTAPAPRASWFALQYPHARCCSLLQAAQRNQLIVLRDWDMNHKLPGAIAAPDPIPWIKGHQWQLTHPTELILLSQLISIIDRLVSRDRSYPAEHWVATVTDLSQIFLKFESACRIWGDVQREQPKLAQARLGLIMATQKVFYSLLEAILGIEAPWEL